MKRTKNRPTRKEALQDLAFIFGVPMLFLLPWYAALIPQKYGVEFEHQTAEAYGPEAPVHIQFVELRRGETPELMEYLFAQAQKHGADPEKMRRTIACETSHTWRADIQSGYHYPQGGREQSFGLAQIHLPDWPDVSRKEAMDAHFAIRFMAEKFGKNQGRLWSCYKKLYGNEPSTI
jgi:hypothetical protein